MTIIHKKHLHDTTKSKEGVCIINHRMTKICISTHARNLKIQIIPWVRESMEKLPAGRTNRKDEMRASSLLTQCQIDQS